MRAVHPVRQPCAAAQRLGCWHLRPQEAILAYPGKDKNHIRVAYETPEKVDRALSDIQKALEAAQNSSEEFTLEDQIRAVRNVKRGLLTAAGAARASPDIAAAALLHDIGMRHGIDAGRGVAVFELAADFSVREPTTRLWVQTEWLKAAMILVRSESEPERRRRFLGDAVAAAKALELFLDLPVRGLWRDKLQGDGTWIDEPAPASSFYHIIDALRVLLQSPAMRGHR